MNPSRSARTSLAARVAVRWCLGLRSSCERVDSAPPRLDLFSMRRLDRLTEAQGIRSRAPVLGAHLEQGLWAGWSQACIASAERAPVHGQKLPPPSQRQRLECVLRPEVNVAPCRMERAHLQHHQVERTSIGRGSSDTRS